jgi:hypothetical protein
VRPFGASCSSAALAVVLAAFERSPLPAVVHSPEGVPMSSLERLARNQALFREVNERINEISAENDKIEFLCECSDTSCIDTLALRASEYLQVRDNPLRFVIRQGHEIEAIERVVAEDGGYVVVEKHEAEADLIDMDPRSSTGS